MSIRPVTGLVCLVALIAVCACDGTVQVLDQPISVYFPEQHSGLHASDVPTIIAQLMGLSSERPEGWSGRGDVLHRPEGWLVLNVGGVRETLRQQLLVDKQLGAHNTHAPTYDVSGQLDNDDLHSVVTRVQTKFGEMKSSVIRATPSYVQTFGQLEFAVTADVPESKTKLPQLREDIANLRRLENFLRTHSSQLLNGSPDVFAFDISGLSGPDATVDDVQELLGVVKKVGAQLSSTYAGNDVMLMLVTDDTQTHIRTKRQWSPYAALATAAVGIAATFCLLLTSSGELEAAPLQAGADPSAGAPPTYEYRAEDFTAMFGIILFLVIFLLVITCAAMCNFWYMDPGKDTIIYRMTMTRAKKD